MEESDTLGQSFGVGISGLVLIFVDNTKAQYLRKSQVRIYYENVLTRTRTPPRQYQT